MSTVHDFFGVVVEQVDRDVDVPLLVDGGRQALLQLQSVGVLLCSEELGQQS